jgi:hypothetical protein
MLARAAAQMPPAAVSRFQRLDWWLPGAKGRIPLMARTNRLLTERWEESIVNAMLRAASQ